jgi:hypothetical protein
MNILPDGHHEVMDPLPNHSFHPTLANLFDSRQKKKKKKIEMQLSHFEPLTIPNLQLTITCRQALGRND